MLALASLSVLAAGCKPADKPAEKPAAKTDAKTDAATTIPGLATEKEQVSYMIGMDLGKSFEPIKDEIDVDMIAKAAKAVMAGEKPLMDEKQAATVRESFGEKMQAKQIAKMMAEAKKNLDRGRGLPRRQREEAGRADDRFRLAVPGHQRRQGSQAQGQRPGARELQGHAGRRQGVRQHRNPRRAGRRQPGAGRSRLARRRVLMPVGSKYRFWIPASLGYGDKVPPGAPIGPNAMLVFEVELLEIVKPGAK